MDDVLIVGKLDDGELRKAIDSLVNDVANKSTQMALTFEQAMDKMTNAMKNFAISQNVSVDLMQEAWKKMSQSFDAMVKAQSSGTGGFGGGGHGSGKPQYDAGTVGAQEELIRLEKQRRKEMYLESEELEKQNANIDAFERRLKSNLTVHRSLDDVLKMREKSVDDVAKKMKALKNVSVDPNNTIEVKKLGDEYQRLKRLQAQLLGQSIQQTKSNNYLAQSFGYIRNRIVYALTLGAITNFIKQVYEIRGQYELLERSLGVLINSFERGSKIFQELNAMSIESPFTLMELAGAAKQLTAYNFSAKEVVDTTRRLADLSAALGVPMERLTYNLGQIRAQTVLTARDARDFANAGLPVVKLLSDYYTELEGKVVSTGDVYDRMSKKMVSYTDVMTVLNKATDEGGKFFDFQAKQAETLRVQMANLTLAYNNMLNEVGKENQGLITAPVKGLKVLFQNWESIARVVKSVAQSFIMLRAVQMGVVYLFQRQGVDIAKYFSGFSAGAKGLNLLSAAWDGFKKSLSAIVFNPMNWLFTAIFAIVDVTRQFGENLEKVYELNQEIRKGATESSNSNLEYLRNKGNQEVFKEALLGGLSSEQGAKAWESIEEQISNSAISANALLGELWQIEDVNERVAKGFLYVESIQRAQSALMDLKDDTIEFTHDLGWFGIFREGLVGDLKDYKDAIAEFNEPNIESISASAIKDAAEFRKELDVTAESINNFLQIHGIEDPKQVREILERIKMQIKMQNPEIKGELAQLFDVELDRRMADLTNGAVDKNYSLWNQFMDRLKHNSSAAFQDITSDIYNKNTKLSEEQQKAVDDNLKYFQDTMPWYYNAVKDMVADASKLKIQIGMAFSIQPLTDFQEQVNERIKNASKVLDFGNASFLPNQNEDLPEWVKRQQDAIKKLKGDIETYSKDNSAWAKQRIDEANTEIGQRTNLLELFGQTAEVAKKTTTKRTSTEDVLGKALQKEVEIITNIQKKYKDYQKLGVDAQTSITKATDEYARTLASTNATLNQFGIKTTKSGKELANMDLRDLRSYYQGLLAMAAGLGNAKGIEVLEKAISNINDEITKLDYKKITDGLNNELGKLKDEYELGIELDANPELGGIFADMMGISQDELQELPRNFEQFVSKAQERINKLLKDNGIDSIFNLRENLNSSNFDEWVKQSGRAADSSLVTELKKYVTEANKIRLDESKNQIEEWNKLLEKYSEYESKVTQIQKEAEKQRETARKAGATKEVFDAINRWEKQELASLSFEEFQKSPEWIVATGDLANLSKAAIGMLIAELEKYKKSAKNLSPKQIKEMNRALSKLYKEQRKGNPFAAIANVIDEAKNNMSAFDEEIEKVNEDIAQTEVAIAQATLRGEDTSKLQSRLKNLRQTWKKLREEQEAAGKIDATTMVGAINETISAVSAAVGVFNDLAKAIGGVNENDIDKTFAILDKAGQGALIGAQIGGGWGAAIGAAAGLATGLIQTLANAGNEKITRQVEDSELAVKRLQNSYNDLQHAVEQAYGAMEIGARKAMVANRELELEELQRQLQLERSRKSKNRDNGRIADLEGQIIDLKNELVDMRAEITNSFLGISSVSDAVTSMMDSIVDALRNGEDAMAKVNDSVDDMIANMIKQVFSAKIVGPMIEDIWNKVDEDIQARGKKWADEYASWKAQYDSISTSTNDTGQGYFFLKKGNEYKATESGFERTLLTMGEKWEEITYDQWKKVMEDNMKNAEGELKKATTPTMDDVRNYAGMLRGVSPELEAYMDDLENILREMGLIKDTTSEKALSSLQQGIQGVTEDTAGAIEAYMNGMSQQVYLQSGVLTQIRDTILGFELDVQVATISQMLLQLQQSYQVQQSIEQVLQNVLNPSGRAFVVELAS